MTPAQLQAIGVSPPIAQDFADPLSAACAINDISTPQRQAAFLAMLAIETTYFRELAEDLYYTDADRVFDLFRGEVKDHEQAARLCRNPQALANTVYAGRNGNTEPGDGWLYRGRGPGLTGRWNYGWAQGVTGQPYLAQPDLVAQPKDCCLVAGWFWILRKCNPLADAGDIDAVTRAWNGYGMAGLADRRAVFARALPVLSST